MQHQLVSNANGDRLASSIASPPFFSPDLGPLSPSYLNSYNPYSIFSPKSNPPPMTSGSVSITPSSIPFNEAEAAATENRLYMSRLALQYQEIAENYDLCLSHLRAAIEEADSLRRENANLRIANDELARRLGLLGGRQTRRVPTSADVSITNELRRLNLSEPPPPDDSPTSVLASHESGGKGDNHQLAGRAVPEKRLALPKSISIRSSGYLKLHPAGGTGSISNRNGRSRVSNPVAERVCVGGGSNKKNGEGGAGGEEEGEVEEEDGDRALELEVYHQGMLKTELCNKWEESGECPYSDHCQFAHGIAELRPVLRHPRYKTQLCRMILSGGTCPYGHRCHFRHSLPTSDHQRPVSRPSENLGITSIKPQPN